ncbi:hypothetical protein AVEN_232551-1, partial [Araneus ventricosus]
MATRSHSLEGKTPSWAIRHAVSRFPKKGWNKNCLCPVSQLLKMD